jgi:hypothetical protein
VVGGGGSLVAEGHGGFNGDSTMAQYRTLRDIANRMRWSSPSTVLRRHKLDDFPLYLDRTKRGLIWVTSDALIEEWERRKVEMCKGARLRYPRRRWRRPAYRPYNWRLRSKNRTGNGTVRPPSVGGSGPASYTSGPLQSQPPAPPTPTKPCTCGTPTPCEATHGLTEEQKA